jgi:hypothetical protein
MSEQNVAVVRDMWEAFLRNDFEAALSAFEPDVEWDGTNLPDGKISHGLDAIVEHLTKWAQPWDTWEVELEQVIDAHVRFGGTGKLLMAFGGGAHCTVELGTTFFVNGFSGSCDNASRPPYFGADEQAQRECVLAYLPPVVESIRLTVDGGTPVNLHTSLYAIFAPQQTVDLPPVNVLRLQPQTITFTPYGWEAWLTRLPVGEHTIEAETRFNDGSEPHITVHPDRARAAPPLPPPAGLSGAPPPLRDRRADRPAILCELGDVGRLSTSRQAVRCSGLDIGVHRSDAAPGPTHPRT